MAAEVVGDPQPAIPCRVAERHVSPGGGRGEIAGAQQQQVLGQNHGGTKGTRDLVFRRAAPIPDPASVRPVRVAELTFLCRVAERHSSEGGDEKWYLGFVIDRRYRRMRELRYLLAYRPTTIRDPVRVAELTSFCPDLCRVAERHPSRSR